MPQTEELDRYIKDKRFLDFFGIAEDLVRTLDEEASVPAIFHRLESILGAEKVRYAYLYRASADQQQLELVSSHGIPVDYLADSEATAMNRHPGYVFRQGSLLVNNVDDPQLKDLVTFPRSDFIPAALLVVPVKYGSKTMGVLGIGSEDKGVYTFDNDVPALELAARYIAIALQNRELLTMSAEAADTPAKRAILAATHLAEAKDQVTGGHIVRVGMLASYCARRMGIPDGLFYAAMSHDLGKISVPDDILSKPEALNESELKIMRKHPRVGAELIRGMGIPELDLAAEIAYAHHERFDGKGYPRGLRDEEIPLAARITCVADAFDAMTDAARPYNTRRAVTRNVAMERIHASSGTQFDPMVVRAFTSMRETIEQVYTNPQAAYRSTLLPTSP